MKVHQVALLLAIGAVLLAPAVSAQLVEEKAGYTVTTDAGRIRLPVFSPLSAGLISQGQTISYSTQVPAGKTTLFPDLNWGVSSNSLSLTINAPDATLGPYYDSDDGQINGRIYLRITKQGGITPGMWTSYVHGYSVSGTQSFTYTVSAS